MQFIVITSPDFLPGEASFITNLLEWGVDKIHLRKPSASYDQCTALLDSVPCQWHKKIVLHGHFSLLRDFRLGGVHLNRRNPLKPSDSTITSVSASCHSLSEVEKKKEEMDYVFLSPIFDSISKQGYCAAFTQAELDCTQIDRKVIALGGVTLERLPLLRRLGFGGAAFLGDIWSRMNDVDVEQYVREIRRAL